MPLNRIAASPQALDKLGDFSKKTAILMVQYLDQISHIFKAI